MAKGDVCIVPLCPAMRKTGSWLCAGHDAETLQGDYKTAVTFTKHIAFTVLGSPATKGSTVSFIGDNGKIVTRTDSTGLSSWTQAVGWAARAARVRVVPRPGAVRVSVRFESVKPPSASGRVHPTVKPDIDKTLRALLDALTGVAYEDDSQVVEVAASKVYAAQAQTVIEIAIVA